MTIFIQQVVNGLMLGGLYVMVAVAFTLIVGMLNFLNFTIPALFMVAAVTTWATMAGGFGVGVDSVLVSLLGADNRWIAGAILALMVVSLPI